MSYAKFYNSLAIKKGIHVTKKLYWIAQRETESSNGE